MVVMGNNCAMLLEDSSPVGYMASLSLPQSQQVYQSQYCLYCLLQQDAANARTPTSSFGSILVRTYLSSNGSWVQCCGTRKP
jgi:hypothetical protein